MKEAIKDDFKRSPRPLDVSPEPESDITKPVVVGERLPGGSYQEAPERKPKKNWMDKVSDLLVGDRSIAKANDKVKQAQEVLSAAEFEARKVRVVAEDAARIQARRTDPAIIAEDKRVNKIHAARLTEAKVLCAMHRRAAEDLRRNPIADDDPDLGFYMSQLDRRELMGTVFSVAPSKQKK